MISAKYILSESEIKLAEKIGRRRCFSKNRTIVQNDSGYHQERDRSFPHVIGVKAEIAYASVAGKTVNQDYFEFTGDQDDFDGIEVKTSTWRGEDIELKVKVSEYRRKNPIGYVLCRLIGNEVTFMGSINRKRFDNEKYLRKHKFVENYCVLAKQLSPKLPVKIDSKIVLFDLKQ
tara:strand:+ start:93 stop:617 length:525 start_codon:yes stop_codon:yes gene_type:complete